MLLPYILIPGDARDVLRSLPDGFVQCVVTSPPYWGPRTYDGPLTNWGGDPDCKHRWGKALKSPQRLRNGAEGGLHAHRATNTLPVNTTISAGAFCACGAWRGSLGQEPTLAMYVEHIVEIMREVRRVLRGDGTLWLNLGDSYNAAGRKGQGARAGYKQGTNRASAAGADTFRPTDASLKPKDLCGIPARVVLALQADGWWWRSDIIWAKPNPMTESVKDRPTQSHEHVYLLTKRARYYYDAFAIAEPAVGGGTRNKRDVWAISPQPYRGAHFATFPAALVEPCLLAGTSERGACPECGAPWARVMKRTKIIAASYRGHRFDKGKNAARDGGDRTQKGVRYELRPAGWKVACKHKAEPMPCVVLDPFVGSGTTGVAAMRHGRVFVGIDLSRKYLRMAQTRIKSELV